MQLLSHCVLQLEEVNQEVCTSSKEVENGNQKVIDLRCQLQSLEIDLQAQCNLVSDDGMAGTLVLNAAIHGSISILPSHDRSASPIASTGRRQTTH